MSPPRLVLKQMELGPMMNFIYLIGCPETREAAVVDPAWEIDTIVSTAQEDGLTLTGALVTHTHQDHVGGSLASWGMPGRIPGVEELLAKVPAKVYVHKAEREFLHGFGSDLVKVTSGDTLAVGEVRPIVRQGRQADGDPPRVEVARVDGGQRKLDLALSDEGATIAIGIEVFRDLRSGAQDPSGLDPIHAEHPFLVSFVVERDQVPVAEHHRRAGAAQKRRLPPRRLAVLRHDVADEEVPRLRTRLDVGPEVKFAYRMDTTTQVTARQIRHPVSSPDGRKIAFTAFDRVWVKDMPDGAARRPQAGPLTTQAVSRRAPRRRRDRLHPQRRGPRRFGRQPHLRWRRPQRGLAPFGAWRCLGAWWAPRSSKPMSATQSRWRVRFPSASATMSRARWPTVSPAEATDCPLLRPN